MQRVYLDSNVFISLVRSEIGKGFRILGVEAENFFAHCKGKYLLVISRFFAAEVEDVIGFSLQDIQEELEALQCSWEYGGESPKKELVDAFKRKGIHSSDAMHAAHAVSAHCAILATFNVSDFLPLQGQVRVCEPRELC